MAEEIIATEEQYQEPQQQPEPPSKELWKKLNDAKAYTLSYDQFRKDYSTQKDIDELHQALSSAQAYTNSKDDFYKDYFSDLKFDTVKNNDAISLVTDIDKLSKEGEFLGAAGTGGGGGAFVQSKSAAEKTVANKEKLKQFGYKDEDIAKIRNEWSDFPEEALNVEVDDNGTKKKLYTKAELNELRESDYQGYLDKINGIKTFFNIRKSQGNNSAANEFARLQFTEPTGNFYNDLVQYQSNKKTQEDIINSTLEGEDREKAINRLNQSAESWANRSIVNSEDAKQAIQAKLETKNGITVDIAAFDVPELKEYLDLNNPVEKVLYEKYKNGVDLRKSLEGSANLDEAAMKYWMAQDDKLKGQVEMSGDLPNNTKGELVNAFLENSELKEMAKNNPELAKMYQQTKYNIAANYPDYAKRKVGQAIGQELENSGATNWFANIPTQEEVDKVVDKLVESGKLSEQDRNTYSSHIKDELGYLQSIKRGVGRIPFGAFVEKSPIPTSGFLENTLEGFNETMRGTARSIEDIVSFTNPALRKVFSDDKRMYNIMQENSALQHIVPKTKLHEISEGTGHLTGFMAGMLATGGILSSVKAGHLINNALMFEGANRDKALMEFPDDVKKRYLYTALATAGDVMLGELIPTKAVSKAVSNSFKNDIKDIVSKLADNSISSGEAKEALLKRAAELFPDLVLENAKTAGIMAGGFGVFHNALDSIFGVNDMSLQDIAQEAIKSYKSTFLTTPLLSAFAVYGKNKKVGGKILLEIADNPELYKKQIEEAALTDKTIAENKEEALQNLDALVSVSNSLEGTKLTEQQKEKYVVNAMAEKVWERKALNTSEENIASDYRKKAQEFRDKKEAIYKGEDKATDYEKYDTNNPQEVFTSKNEQPTQEVGTDIQPTIEEAKGQELETRVQPSTEPMGKGTAETTPTVLEAPRLKGEPEQISQPIELSLEPQNVEKAVKPETTETVSVDNPALRDVESTEKALDENIPFERKRQEAINLLPTEKVHYKNIKGVGDLSIYLNNPKALKNSNLKSAYKIYEQLKNGEPIKDKPYLTKNNELLDGQNRIAAQLALGNENVEVVKVDKDFFDKSETKQISEAYHKAKADGSNPELVKAVEELLSKPETKTEVKSEETKVPIPTEGESKSNEDVNKPIGEAEKTEGKGEEGKLTLNKDNKVEFVTKSKRQKVTFVDGDLEVVDAKTGKQVDAKTKKKALQEYADAFDFSVGKEVTEFPEEVKTTDDAIGYTIENSENPYQLANIYVAEEPTLGNISTVERMIADFGIGKIKGKSYNQFGDRNNMTLGKARRYINKDGRSIDVVAAEMSDHYGVEITPQDIVSFMDKFPDGVQQALKMVETANARQAADKFKKLTGLTLNNEVAKIVIEKEFNKLKKEQQSLAEQDYENARQLEEAYWEQFAKTDGFTKESPISETKQTETKGENKPPIEPPTEVGKGIPEENKELIGISHKRTNEIAKELGLGEYEKSPETIKGWDEQVDKILAENPNAINEMLDKYKSGGKISHIDQRMMFKYHAALKDRINKNPTSELLQQYAEAKTLSDVEGGRNVAKSLAARRGTIEVAPTFADYILDEARAHQLTTLPEQVIKDLKAKYEANEEVVKQLNERIAKLEQAQFEKEQSKQKPVKGTKAKTKEDYKAERKNYLEELKAAKEEHLKWMRDNGISNQSVVPNGGVVLTTKMAKIILKIVKSHAEEIGANLQEVVSKVYDEVKDVFDGITERDVRDVISGVYNEKKLTRNEIAEKMRDLRDEQILLDKINALEKGEKIEKDPIKKQRKREDIDKLKERLKELTPEDKKGLSDEQKLAMYKKRIANEIERLKKDLETGDYMKEPEPKKKLELDEEALRLKDEHIKFVKETNLRRAKAEYEKRSKSVKAYEGLMQFLGIRRIVNTAVDLSIPFRQGVTIMFNPRKFGFNRKSFTSFSNFKNTIKDIPNQPAIKSFITMFKTAFSTKRFDRIMFDIHKSPEFKNMLEDGVVFNEMDAVDSNTRNEDFQKSFIYKIPYLRGPLLASNRAADGFLNTARYEMYLQGKNNLMAQGITREKHPEQYKELSKWVMNITGRGNLLKLLEDSSAGKEVANNTFFGARLMASRFNLLNPLYYAKMPKEIRVNAMKDMAAFTGSIFALGLAAVAAGGKVSFDPDDSEFLKVQFGNTKYDLSGGMVQYIRTYIRLTRAIGMRLSPKYSREEANDYAIYAMKSTRDFFRYKLAPNTSYAISGFLGTDPMGKPFNPLDALHIYPMYVDDAVAGYKEQGLVSLATIFAPSVLGIGVQTYEDKNKLYDKNEKLSSPMQVLKEKGIELPKAQGIKAYKVDINDSHPEGIMTEDEYKQFLQYKKEFFEKEVEEILKSRYEVYDEDSNLPSKLYLGSELPIEDLKEKISTASANSTKLAKQKMGLEKEKGEHKVENIDK